MRIDLRLLGLLGLLLCLTQLAWAGPREELQALYDKSYQAAVYKYRFGMISFRAKDFKAYDADGYLVSPKRQNTALDALLAQALSLQETGKVLSLNQVDDNTVECEVEDLLTAVLVEGARRNKRSTLVVTTRSIDTWKWNGKTWEQTQSRILEQSSARKPL